MSRRTGLPLGSALRVTLASGSTKQGQTKGHHEILVVFEQGHDLVGETPEERNENLPSRKHQRKRRRRWC